MSISMYMRMDDAKAVQTCIMYVILVRASVMHYSCKF